MVPSTSEDYMEARYLALRMRGGPSGVTRTSTPQDHRQPRTGQGIADLFDDVAKKIGPSDQVKTAEA